MLIKKKIFNTIITVALTLGFSISLQSLLAAWSAPTAVAPANNATTPINVGNIGQSKNSGLILNAGNVNANGLVVEHGKVAINSNNTNATLDVNGEVKIGYSGVACTSTNEGAIRYSAVTKSPQYCDSIAWREFYPEYPAGLNFTNLIGQNLNTVVYSNIVTPTNFQRSAVSVVGTGSSSPQVNCNGAGWTSGCMLYVGNTLRIRMTTANAYVATTTATIVMGGSSATWNVVTKPNSMVNCKAWYDAGYTADGPYLIDPDGAGAIAAENLYCKMSGGKWALVVGIDVNNTNHMNSAAVTSSNLSSLTGKGKVSDAFINALKSTGMNQLAIEAMPQWNHCKDGSVVEGFSTCYQAWLYSNCQFSSSQTIGTVPNYTNCITGDYNIENWKNSATGMGVAYANWWGGFYGVAGWGGLHEQWVSAQYAHIAGRLWAR